MCENRRQVLPRRGAGETAVTADGTNYEGEEDQRAVGRGREAPREATAKEEDEGGQEGVHEVERHFGRRVPTK